MRTVSRPVTGAAVLATALTLSACGSPATTGPDHGDGENAPTTDSASALEFTTTTVDGADFSGTELEDTPAVLWFWAPWCTVCQGEAGTIAEAADRHADRVEFYGIPGRGDVPEMEEFISDTGTGGMTHLVDEDGAIWSGFEVTGQPALTLLRSDGTFHTVPGTVSADDIDTHIDEQLDV